GLVLVVWLPVFHRLDSGLESSAWARLPQDDKQAKAATEPYRGPDVPYVPTPRAVVEQMLELAEVKKGDVVYDLGCGDGRLVVTAAKKYGVKAVGVDNDQERGEEARAEVGKNKLAN